MNVIVVDAAIVAVGSDGRVNGVKSLGVIVGMVVVDAALVAVVDLGLTDNDVVVGVAVVGNEGAAIVVAGKLNLIRVDVRDRGDDAFAVHLDHSLGGRDSGGGKLGIGAVGGLNVASDETKLNAVGARRLNVVGVDMKRLVVVRVDGVRVEGVTSATDDDVVVWVAVVGDEGTAAIIDANDGVSAG